MRIIKKSVKNVTGDELVIKVLEGYEGYSVKIFNNFSLIKDERFNNKQDALEYYEDKFN